jgi:hypothetical protein
MRALPGVAVGALTLGFALTCALFVRQATLATFADDSVSYLVMAQVFSPWQAATAPVGAAFASEAFYPPLFPWVLALAGAAHDLAWAHVLNALILAACLPLMYLLGVRWLASRGAAAVAALVVALLPASWINAKGILSEPLFCVLLLATLLALDAGRRRGLLALLMAALLLTRTAAVAPIAAYAAWAFVRGRPGLGSRAKAMLPALAAVLAYGAWVLLRPAATTDSYARLLLDNAAALGASADPWSAARAILGRQLHAIGEGWIGSLLIYWVEGRPARTILAAAVGVLALAGLALRLKERKADGWMTGAYLVLFLVWPFYDQMGRFLFPILPVLVLYAFAAAGRLLEAAQRPAALGYAALALLTLSLTVPALGFLYQRAQAPGPVTGIVDWYRTPDLAQARARAEVHLGLMADMEAIRSRTREGERVMWTVPSYVALLANREGVKAPDAGLGTDAYRTAVRQSGADHVFLSRFNPRDTLSEAAWQAGLRALAWRPAAEHVRALPDGTVASMLLKAPK